jgi:hypothetical protein
LGEVAGLPRASGGTRSAIWAQKWLVGDSEGPRDLAKTSRKRQVKKWGRNGRLRGAMGGISFSGPPCSLGCWLVCRQACSLPLLRSSVRSSLGFTRSRFSKLAEVSRYLGPEPVALCISGLVSWCVVWTCLSPSASGSELSLVLSRASTLETSETTAIPCWDASGRLLCSAPIQSPTAIAGAEYRVAHWGGTASTATRRARRLKTQNWLELELLFGAASLEFGVLAAPPADGPQLLLNPPVGSKGSGFPSLYAT